MRDRDPNNNNEYNGALNQANVRDNTTVLDAGIFSSKATTEHVVCRDNNLAEGAQIKIGNVETTCTLL